MDGGQRKQRSGALSTLVVCAQRTRRQYSVAPTQGREKAWKDLLEMRAAANASLSRRLSPRREKAVSNMDRISFRASQTSPLLPVSSQIFSSSTLVRRVEKGSKSWYGGGRRGADKFATGPRKPCSNKTPPLVSHHSTNGSKRQIEATSTFSRGGFGLRQTGREGSVKEEDKQ